MSSRRGWLEVAGWIALVAAGAGLRLMLRDVPNFAPVAALSLFGGYVFRSRIAAVLLPLSIMAASDTVIGGYDWELMAVVYGALALPAVFGAALQRFAPDAQGRSLAGRTAVLMSASLGSSVLFFLTTNLAVWAWSNMYEHTAAGLFNCYVRALPFFRHTLEGDLLFTVILFGAHAAWKASSVESKTQEATVGM